jgi:integrase
MGRDTPYDTATLVVLVVVRPIRVRLSAIRATAAAVGGSYLREAAAADPGRDASAHHGAGQAPAPGGARGRGPARSPLRVAIHTGLRQGELLGLKWDDVDLEDGIFQVRRTLAITKNGPVFTSPKTSGSRRSVKLTRKAIEALKGHLERQLAEIDRVGSLWNPGDSHGLIFASETGEPLDRRVVTKSKFKPLPKRAGIPEIRFHDLRHTCATLLLTRNVNPKIVSEMLGHATIAITLDTYSHVLQNMRDQAAAAMEEALS